MATFTSVSLMSTSSWDDAAGCPIVSPCRWNSMVASNIAVLANHNHSASLGEGASTPFAGSLFASMDVQYISPWFPITNVGWTPDLRSTWPGLGCMSTSTLGAVIEYPMYMRPGTWELVMMTGLGSAMGFISASIGGSAINLGGIGGALDRYVAGAEIPSGSVAFSSLFCASINFTLGANSGNGRTTLRINVSAKNDSSTGYIVRLGYMRIYKVS